jgi:hypothetical protein
LSQVCSELRVVGTGVEQLTKRLAKPIWIIRSVVIGLSALAICVVVAIGINISNRLSSQVDGISDLLQGVEAGINEIIFLFIALYFLGTVEGRLKRYVAPLAQHRPRGGYAPAHERPGLLTGSTRPDCLFAPANDDSLPIDALSRLLLRIAFDC